MASEYLKWKARDEKPPEKPHYTKKEKALNWLYYHKWWLIIGAVVLAVVGSMVAGVIALNRNRPDYVFAYVGSLHPSNETVFATEKALSALADDANGDGKTYVKLNVYANSDSSDPEIRVKYNYANDAKILADMERGESYFFLMDDPEEAQRSYSFLADEEGLPPSEEDNAVADKVYLVDRCPALASLKDNWAAASDLFFGRRYFYGEKAAGHEKERAFWARLIEGATR